MKKDEIVEFVLNIVGLAVGCFLFYHIFLFAFNVIGAAFNLF